MKRRKFFRKNDPLEPLTTEEPVAKITIVGSGNGGSAKAAHLGTLGHDITLYDLPEFSASIEEVKKAGGITIRAVESTEISEGFVKVNKATTDIKEALHGAEIVMVTVPSFAHPKMAEVCAPHLTDGQIVLISPGNLYASIQFMQALRKAGNTADVKLAEAECMIYAVRKEKTPDGGPGVWIRGYKRNLGVGVFPAKDTDAVFDKIAAVYPSLVKRGNILESGMSNMNPFVHVPMALFNIGCIDRAEDLQTYYEALTPSIANIIAAMDEDRMGIARKKFLNILSLYDLSFSWYKHQGVKGETLMELLQSNPAYYRSMLPKTKEHRYFYEDVTYGLFPIIDLLTKFGLPSQTLQELAHLCSLVMGKDLSKGARTLESLGLGALSGEELLKYVHEGI